MTLITSSMVNAYSAAADAAIDQQDAEMIRRRDALLGPAYRLFYREPIHIVRGEGVWLYDRAGRRYLDAYNNVVPVGHCNPRVVAAIARQAAVLNTHTRYLHETILDYAERLLATFPPELQHVMFTCTGSEANDLALRISRHFTGARGVIVTELAYHGITEAVSEISPSLGRPAVAHPYVRTVPAPDSYRQDADAAGSRFVDSVKRAIRELQANGAGVAAFICDSVFSSDGVFTDPTGFLKEAAAAVRAAGGLVIADEVQSGFGRTGAGLWGFTRHDFVPDLVTIGKPMGNGHPIAGLVLRPETVERFGRDTRYFNTFGGNPVSCAAALETLRIIQDDQLVAHARDVGLHLKLGLEKLAARYPVIGDVRGSGLFVGVELVRDRDTKEPASETASDLVNALRQRQVLLSATGPRANILKIRPPLVIETEHADLILAEIEAFLSTR